METKNGLQIIRTCMILFVLVLCANTSVYSIGLMQSDEICETLPMNSNESDKEDKEDAEVEGEKEIVYPSHNLLKLSTKAKTKSLIHSPDSNYNECYLGVISPPPELD